MSIFGVRVSLLPQRERPSPRFLEQCFRYLLENDWSPKIFQEQAPSGEIQKLRNRIDGGGLLDQARDKLKPVTVASLIREFLRRIPDTMFGAPAVKSWRGPMTPKMASMKIKRLHVCNLSLTSRVFGYFVLLMRRNLMQIDEAAAFLSHVTRRRRKGANVFREVLVPKENTKLLLRHYASVFSPPYSAFDENGQWMDESHYQASSGASSIFIGNSELHSGSCQLFFAIDDNKEKMCRNVKCTEAPDPETLYEALMTADLEEALKSADNVTPL